MNSPLLLGIDEGTTAVKAALFDEDLRAVAETRRAVAVTHPRPGWVEQDPELILEAVVDAVAEMLEHAGDREIIAAGLDHQGESVLAWDATSGRALTPVIVWQDKRHESLLSEIPPQAVERSGLPLDPYFSAGKLAWLLDNHEDVRRARDAGCLRLGTVDAFLTDRLGGRFATDLSTASRTQLLATGGHARKRDDATRDELTPQEARIASLAAEGASNSEIGERLFISSSTVAYHLRKVFRKLNVNSRTRLSSALSDDDHDGDSVPKAAFEQTSVLQSAA